MKKLAISLLLSCLLIPAMAQHSLLYKISGKGLKQPSYLYGTIHLICPQDFFIGKQLKQVFTAAKTLYLEMDMDDPKVMMAVMLALQEQKAGYSFEKLFKPEDYQKLSRYFKDSLGMSLANFDKMKPMVVQMTIAQRALTCPIPSSYEQTFVNMAKEQHKPIEGLEKPEEQIAIFDAIPDSAEVRWIMESINDMQKQKTQFAHIVAAYKQQDITAIHAIMKESPETAGFEDEMVYNRNRKWIPLIEKAIQKEATLIAFGAMHLGGNKGVVALLRKQGYKVEPVPNKQD